jgi:lysozyme family protein
MAMQRLLRNGIIQAKLTINQPGDIHEQEAERLADQVVSAAPAGITSGREEEGKLQRQAKPNPTSPATPAAYSQITAFQGGGQPLPPAIRAFFEPRFGADFSQVRVHTGHQAAEAARLLQARAFTAGNDIVFGANEYAPNGTSAGQRLLAHELTHVIQQRLGDNKAGPSAVRQRASGIQRQEATAAAEEAAFVEWWKRVAGFEGTLGDWLAQPANKYDRGGETNLGITKKFYLKYAAGQGLSPTEAGFKNLTPEQALKFGRMMWKVSGANKIKNTGVALVLADWYWGGISLKRFSALLKAKGRAASFNQGKPDQATLDFMNTLPPDELVELLSQAKEAHYREIAKNDPTQQQFLGGWLKRNEERRQQAQPFVAEFAEGAILEHGPRALEQARKLLDLGEAASSEDKKAARDELWAVVAKIEERQKAGFSQDEKEAAIRKLKGQLLKEIGRLMDAGS